MNNKTEVIEARRTLEAAIAAAKQRTFIDPSTATDEDALGIAVAGWAQWDGGKIVETFLSALTDANYHALAATVREAALRDGALEGGHA
jgi:hypothetical protein